MEAQEGTMLESQLAAIIRSQLDQAADYNGGNYTASRELARDYYHSRGLALGTVCKGESDLISADVPDSIDNTLAAMIPAFSSSDLLAEFEADSPEDEDAAEQESKIVSHILVDGNAGVIRQALFDALLLRNTALKVSWSEIPETAIESYENLTVEQMAMAIPQLMGGDSDVEPTDIKENEDGTFNVTLRTKTPRGIPTIQCLPVEEVSVNSSHGDIDVSAAKFVAHSPSDVTASDLVEMGFDPDVVDDIPDYRDTVESLRKNQGGSTLDRSVRAVDIHEVFMLVDYDGDGVAERRRVIMGGDHILDNEEVTDVQVITGSCWPIPHQWEGVSLVDRVLAIQEAKTKLLRQSINVNEYNLLQRVIANPLRVQMEDLQTGARRSVVRAKDPTSDVVPFPQVSLDASTQPLLSQLDKMRSERAGGALDMNMEALPIGANTTAHGVERIMTSMETMVSAYVYNFSQTVIRPLYLQIHRLLREHADGKMHMNIDGVYITSDPSQWRPRTKLNVITGAGLGEQSRKGQAMMNVLMTQDRLLEKGSGLVTEQDVYESLLDSAKWSGLDYPEQYYTDPSSPEAQQAAQQKQQQAQQAQQAQQQMIQQGQEFQKMLVDMTEQTKQMKVQLDAMQKGKDHELAVEKELNQFTLKATELELVHDENIPGASV